MAKVLVITDSLGLPRKKPQICDYEETWPTLLRNSGHVVHQVSIGGATVNELFNQSHYHCSFNPEIVIVQSGIVDCAPRALTKFENLIFNKFYLSRKFMKYILPKITNILRRYRGISYTNIGIYEKNILRFKNQFSDADLFWLSIVPSNEEYEKSVPGIDKNIKKYNSILKKQLKDNLIWLKNIENGVMSDHIHLNSMGHKYIFDLITEKVI